MPTYLVIAAKGMCKVIPMPKVGPKIPYLGSTSLSNVLPIVMFLEWNPGTVHMYASIQFNCCMYEVNRYYIPLAEMCG